MRRVVVVLAALLFMAVSGHATTLLWMDVQDLTRNSTAVVMGRVASQETLTSEPGASLNQVRFAVEKSLKGDLEGSVVVNNPGFAGAPVFNDGDELVLFLFARDNTQVITGFQQGSFKILTDALGRKVLDRAIPSRVKSDGGPWTLEALESEVLAVVEQEVSE